MIDGLSIPVGDQCQDQVENVPKQIQNVNVTELMSKKERDEAVLFGADLDDYTQDQGNLNNEDKLVENKSKELKLMDEN